MIARVRVTMLTIIAMVIMLLKDNNDNTLGSSCGTGAQGSVHAPAQAKLAQLRQHAEDMVQSVLSNPKISEQALRDLAEHERRASFLSCPPRAASSALLS